jgi:hypothetical protein
MTSRWPTLRVLLTAHLKFAVLAALAIAVVTAAVTSALAIWGHVDRSIWRYGVTQVMRWFVFGLGFDVITTYLRLQIAHGRTRGDFLRQLWPYLVTAAVSFSLLVAVGYLVESGVYGLSDTPHELPVPTMFGTTGSIPGIVGAFTLMFMLWAIAGVLLATAFTRNFLLGLLTVPLGLLVVAPSEVPAGNTWVPLLQNLPETWQFSTVTSIAFGLAAIVVGCTAIWGIVRDMPMRPKVA